MQSYSNQVSLYYKRKLWIYIFSKMSPVPPYKHLCGITHFEYSLNFEIPNILPKANTAPYHGNNLKKKKKKKG